MYEHEHTPNAYTFNGIWSQFIFKWRSNSPSCNISFVFYAIILLTRRANGMCETGRKDETQDSSTNYIVKIILAYTRKRVRVENRAFGELHGQA